MSGPSPGADRTRVRDLDIPRPGPGQVTIDVGYAGINFIDVMARRGDPGYASGWPYVPGLEVAGTIREVGAGVMAPPAGRRVAAFTRGGGLAEVAVADAALVVPVPDEVGLPAAAAAPLMLSSASLLLSDVVRIRPNETILMHSSSGGLGRAIAQLALQLGAVPSIGTVGWPEKAAGALRSGWHRAFARDAGLAGAVRAAVPDGVDVILDPSGTALLDVDLEVAAPGGRIVLFGNPGGEPPGPLPPLAKLIGGNVAIAGFSMSRLTATSPARAAQALQRVLRLLAGEQLDLAVTELGSLDDVPAAQQSLAEGRSPGKYVAATR
jgi:NADPH:quinone reductase